MKEKAPAHSELGASGMHRWRNCPGSVKLSRGVPNVSSKFAEEGTEAHALAASILEARRFGKREPDLFEYEEEMIDMVGIYADHINDLPKYAHGAEAIQLFEHRFDLSSIFPGCFGTADAVTFFPDEGLLIVTDLKYGAGILVDVKDNPQLKYYALGAVVSLKWPVKKIRLEIVQPRTWVGDPISKYEMDIFELWEFADEIVEAAQRTMVEDTQLAVGDWCRFCPAAAAGICPLIKQQMIALPTGSLLNYDIPPINYEELGRMIKLSPIIKGILSQMTEFAYQQAMKGVKIPGTKLVKKRPSRRFKHEEAAMEVLGEHLTADQLYEPRRLKSAAQLEKIKAKEIAIPKKEFKKILDDLTEKISSGCSLVSEDDDRPEIKQIEAKAVFVSAVENDAFN